ncbi:PIG-L family deacetylase [Clostridiaceae bacterium M8S5]|nr:PIG-L family deacetylase [Clostridiaceae bacterium M8S5]
MSRILVVSAHPDDEILGIGGTVRKHVNKGDTVDCLILGEGLTSREGKGNCKDNKLNKLHTDAIKASKIVGYRELFFSKLPDNRLDSIDLLDVIKEIEKYILKLRPHIVYTHHYSDLNIDHKITFEAVLTACRPVGDYSVKEIYCYETPSSTEWNFKYESNIFKPNVFVDINDTLNAKLDAMACYETEIREYPHPRSLEALKIIAQRWGTVVNKKYVEAFELIRKVD